MRTIKKRSPPKSLVQWRQSCLAKADLAAHPFNYKALRNTSGLAQAVETGLFKEQGEICAYTGRRISMELKPKYYAWFHIEHLKGQTRCRTEADQGLCDKGFDAHYENMVACWPEPNRKEAVCYGAVLKDEWPKTKEEDYLFISPLKNGCAARFKFSRQGEISAARRNDAAAVATIKKLGLDHKELNALRLNAIRGAFSPNNIPLSFERLERVRKALDVDELTLDSGKNVQLREYCFVIRANIDREISKLRGIAASKRKLNKPKRK
jgi:uncharacterized protein (TIGR02646 family)